MALQKFLFLLGRENAAVPGLRRLWLVLQADSGNTESVTLEIFNISAEIVGVFFVVFLFQASADAAEICFHMALSLNMTDF